MQQLERGVSYRKEGGREGGEGREGREGERREGGRKKEGGREEEDGSITHSVFHSFLCIFLRCPLSRG